MEGKRNFSRKKIILLFSLPPFPKISVVREWPDHLSTSVGVSKYPLQDFDYRTTSDMWLYRAHDGGVYHDGERARRLDAYGPGDTVTVEVDMDEKTIAFGKNDEVSSKFPPSPPSTINSL